MYSEEHGVTATRSAPPTDIQPAPRDGSFDEHRPAAYDPRLYVHQDLAPTVDGWDSVTPADEARFHAAGFPGHRERLLP